MLRNGQIKCALAAELKAMKWLYQFFARVLSPTHPSSLPLLDKFNASLWILRILFTENLSSLAHFLFGVNGLSVSISYIFRIIKNIAFERDKLKINGNEVCGCVRRIL